MHLQRLCLVALVAGLCSCRTEEAAHTARPAQEAARAPQPARDPVSLRYTITYVREPERALDVEVALSDGAPRDFLFTQAGGVETVRVYGDTGEARELSASDGIVKVPSGTRSLRYRYTLGAHKRRRWWDHGGAGQGDAMLIAGRTWLIRPWMADPRLQAELSIQGVDVLLPWQPGPSGVYRLRAEDLVDSGLHGFGGRRCQVQLSDAVLDVGILGPMTNMDDAQVCEWLRQTAEQVRTIRHRFPHPRVTVLVQPIPKRRDPNIFGMVMWSTPPSVGLLVGQDTTREALARDWVALHEMLHLTHPTIMPRTPWISEGLATYLTEVARARSGTHTPERSWQALLRGFERSKAEAAGRTLQEMIDENSPPEIYWVGAFIALRLDVELRRVTHNQRGLGDVLELLATKGSTSTVAGYGAAVDEVAGRPLFDALLAEDLRRPAFAALEGLLEDLGVTPTPGGVKLQLARDSLLREALDGQSARSAQ